MPCRFASSGTVATSRSASRAILALKVASNFLRDLVISVLHRLRQSRTLHTLTFGPISGVRGVPVNNYFFELLLMDQIINKAGDINDAQTTGTVADMLNSQIINQLRTKYLDLVNRE